VICAPSPSSSAPDESWKAGFTGKGVDIALIDSGVSPVRGLTSGNVVNGPDLSFESQDPATTNLDTFGHGTHMAGSSPAVTRRWRRRTTRPAPASTASRRTPAW
jgi:subtilisin family serine protease